MFKPINEYILLTREARRSHLVLGEPCSEIGGYSKEFRGMLAYHLKTTIPSGRKIFLCHACHNDKCSNVNHLYWGSPKDNAIDCFEDRGTIHSRTSPEVRLRQHKNAVSRGSKGGKGNLGKPKSEEHTKNVSVAITKWHAERKKQKELSMTQGV